MREEKIEKLNDKMDRIGNIERMRIGKIEKLDEKIEVEKKRRMLDEVKKEENKIYYVGKIKVMRLKD